MRPPPPINPRPPKGDEQPVGFPWVLVDTRALETRRGRLHFVLAVVGAVVFFGLFVALSIHGRDDIVLGILLSALLGATVCWVLAGEKGGRT
jgi:hypothetical protein